MKNLIYLQFMLTCNIITTNSIYMRGAIPPLS